MIAKRIDHEPRNDNFRALALYVAGIGEPDDKVLMKWTAGCQMDDFYGVLKEIEVVQAKNTLGQGQRYGPGLGVRQDWRQDSDHLKPRPRIC